LATEFQSSFISYCRTDSDFALKLAGDLKSAGAEVWLDQLSLALGDQWDQKIQRALNDHPWMIVILSPASVESTNVLDEISFALKKQKTVIPVVYQTCEIPYRIDRIHRIDFTLNYERGLEHLLRHLHVKVEASGEIRSTETEIRSTEIRCAEEGSVAEARAEAAAKSKAAAEEKERAEAAAKSRAVAEEKARAEAEAKSKAAAEDRGRAEAAAKAEAAAEDRERAEAAAKAKAAAEDRGRAEAAAKAEAAAEDRERAEAAAKAKAAAEDRARAEAAAKAKAAAEDRERAEAAAKAKAAAEDRERAEAAAKTKAAAEDRARAEAAAKPRPAEQEDQIATERSTLSGGRRSTYLVLLLVIIAAGFALVHWRSAPREPVPPPGGWQAAPFDYPEFSNCMGVQECLDQKSASIAIKEKTENDWKEMGYDDPLLKHCMTYQPCVVRHEQAERLVGISALDWGKVFDPKLLGNCMKFEPCLKQSQSQKPPHPVVPDTSPTRPVPQLSKESCENLFEKYRCPEDANNSTQAAQVKACRVKLGYPESCSGGIYR
jgi:hypothetical protein